MSYGQAVKAKMGGHLVPFRAPSRVSVGSYGRNARVAVGADCGLAQPMSQDWPSGAAAPWAPLNCPPPGPQLQILGAARETVTAGSTATIEFTTRSAFAVHQLVIPEALADNFIVTSIKSGLREIITGGEVHGSTFNSLNDNCTRLFTGFFSYPAVPLEVTVVNISNADSLFMGALWGTVPGC